MVISFCIFYLLLHYNSLTITCKNKIKNVYLQKKTGCMTKKLL